MLNPRFKADTTVDEINVIAKSLCDSIKWLQFKRSNSLNVGH